MSDSPVRGAARPRQATTDAIVSACVAELTELGYHRLSMESVARRAGVGKAALYRRWPNKQTMVAAVVQHITQTLRPELELGDDDAAADLTAFAAGVVRWLEDPRIMADLVAAGLRDDDLRDVLRGAVTLALQPSRDQVLQRAEGRGEDVDQIETTMTDITAIVFWRRAVRGERFGPSDIAAMVRRCL